jgi:hypothetical protein
MYLFYLLQKKGMNNFFQAIKQLQLMLQGTNFVRLRTAFGANFIKWFTIFRKVLFVAKKLSRPHSGRVSKSYSKCFRLLTEFYLQQNDWDSVLFQQTLEQFDPEFSQLFLQIVAGIMNHPRFSAYVEESRRWFREGEQLGLNPDRRSPHQQIRIYKTRSVIDSLAGMVVHPTLIG